MIRLSKLVVCLSLLLFIVVDTANAASSSTGLLSMTVDVKNRSKLQRGAQLYMNYCSGCHSLKYMRYNKMAVDLGLTSFTGELDKALLQDNLIFTGATVYDPIQIAMSLHDAEMWFGVVPPDLSLTAREKGTDWIYTYLSSFYADDTRPLGTNNLLVPGVAMPNVLEILQGHVYLKYPEKNPEDRTLSDLVLVEPGDMTQPQFDSALQDLVTFLAYVAEPVKLVRYHMGVYVLAFLMVLAALTFFLKRMYWQSIKKD